MDAANAFSMGADFGQIDAYAGRGIQYALIQKTIIDAGELAKKIPQLSMQQPLFKDLLNRLGEGTGIATDTVTNGKSLADLSNKYMNDLVGLIPYPTKHVIYAGYFLGRAEANALTGAQDANLDEALYFASSTGLWTNPEGLINWAKSRFNTPYYQKAIYGAKRLLHSELVGRPQQFSAGAANVPIVIGAGQSILTQTFARALVIDDGQQRVAIVQVDTTTIDVIYSTPIKELVNSLVKMDGIMLVASHTHCPSNTIRDDNPTFTMNVADAIIIAAGDLVVAEVGVAKGVVLESFNRVKRKDNPPPRTSERFFENCLHPNLRLADLNSRPLDPVYNDIDILHIRSISDTTTIATLVNYAAHGVFIKFDPAIYGRRVSADYPGAIVDYVSLPRQKGGLGGECLFLQGAAGDIHPYCCLEDDIVHMNAMADDIGETVVAQTLAIAAYESNFPILFTEQVFSLENKWNFYAYNPLNPSEQTGFFPKYQTYISALLLDKHIALVGMPGEFFTSLGQNLRSQSPCKNTFFLGYCNDFIAYVPSADDWGTGGYGTTYLVGDFCRIKQGTGEAMVGQAVELIGDLMKK